MLRKEKIGEVVRIAHQVILTKMLFDSFLKYTFCRQRYEDGLKRIETGGNSSMSRKDRNEEKKPIRILKGWLAWKRGLGRRDSMEKERTLILF